MLVFSVSETIKKQPELKTIMHIKQAIKALVGSVSR